MAIARFPSIVLDCPDPLALATFYGAILDWEVDTANADESDGASPPAAGRLARSGQRRGRAHVRARAAS